MSRRFLIVGLATALGAAAGGAAADLYRWIDPETGSVKFSNIPPPWFGKPELQRRAPRVEHIPERQRPSMAESEPAPAVAAARQSPGPGLEELEGRRKQMLQQISASLANSSGIPNPALQKLMEEYVQLLGEIDQVDPKGAAARQAETQSVLAKSAKGALR